MQSSGLSGPAQGPLSLKLYELCTADKVSKKPLGKLGKLVGELGRAQNNSELMNEIKLTGKSTGDLKGLFISLHGRLAGQNSRMFDKKQRQLKSIEKIIIPVAKEIDIGKKMLRIDSVEGEIRVTKKEVAKLDGENRKNGKKIARLEESIRWANTSDSDLESIRNKRRERAVERIANVQKQYERKISTIDSEIQSLTNSKDRAVEHASSHGVAVSRLLDLAIAGKVYDLKDTGFGPTMLSTHIASDEFAMKEFGYVKKEGYGKYAQDIKVPNAEGEMWKRLLKVFMGSPAKLDKLQSTKAELEKEYRQLVVLMTREAESPDNKISGQEINEKNNYISTFKEENESREKKITEFKDSISELKQERIKLFEEIRVL